MITPEGIKIECSLSHRNKANAVMRQFEDQNYGQDPSMASPHMYSPSQHPMDRNRGHATANVYMPNQENITLSSDSTDESQWNAPYHTGKDGNKYAASQRSPASTATSGMYGHDAGSSSSHSYMDSNAGPMHPPPPPPPQPVYNSPPILNPNYSMYLSTISMQQQQYLQSMNNSFTPTYSTPNMMPSPVPPPGYMTIAPPPPAPQPAYRINGYPPIGMMRYQTAEYPMMDMNQQESQPRNVYMPRPQQYHPHQHQPHQHQPPPSYQPSGYGKPY